MKRIFAFGLIALALTAGDSQACFRGRRVCPPCPAQAPAPACCSSGRAEVQAPALPPRFLPSASEVREIPASFTTPAQATVPACTGPNCPANRTAAPARFFLPR